MSCTFGLSRIVVATFLGIAGVAVGCGSDSDSHHNPSHAQAGAAGTAGTAGSLGSASTLGNAGTAGASSPTTGGVIARLVGSTCSADEECPVGGSGTPACISDWPEGYCAVKDCAVHGHDCPNDPGQAATNPTNGAKCVLAPTATCLALCASNADCRAGYECAVRDDAAGHGTATVCVPNVAGAASTTGGQAGMAGGAMTGGASMMNSPAGANSMMVGAGGAG